MSTPDRGILIRGPVYYVGLHKGRSRALLFVFGVSHCVGVRVSEYWRNITEITKVNREIREGLRARAV